MFQRSSCVTAVLQAVSARRRLTSIRATLAIAFGATALTASARGIEVGVPAYVFPGDPYLSALEDPVKAPVPPSIVIVNIASGDADESTLDHDADLLRARIAANGDRVSQCERTIRVGLAIRRVAVLASRL